MFGIVGIAPRMGVDVVERAIFASMSSASLNHSYCLADREDAVEEAFDKLMHRKDRLAWGLNLPQTEKDWFKNLWWQARASLSHMKDRFARYAKYVEFAAKERFKDRLDAIMKRYDGNWEQMIKEYEQLKAEMDNGREPDPRFKPVQAPFYGSLKSKVNVELTDAVDAALVRETKNICSDIKTAININNFWDKPNEVKKLHDKIASRVRLGLRGTIAESADAAQEIMGICRSNYCNILRKLDDLA